MLVGSVGSPTAPWPGLRTPAAPSRPSTPHRAFALLWNFPGGNLPQRASLAPHAQYILSLVLPPQPPAVLGSGTEPPGVLRPPIRGAVEQPGKETGPLVTPSYLSPLPTSSRHVCDLSFSVVYCVEARPSSQLGAGPASRSRDGRPSQAQSSPRLPSLQPPLSQAGPKLWPGRTLTMEPQGLSPLLSAHVYSLTCVCLMILFQVTPQSGWGLHAILLRPLSSPRP